VHLTDVLDVLGIVLLVAFAFLIWPPAALAVAGAAILAASFFLSRRGRK
jgi:uncharacterized membrane protein